MHKKKKLCYSSRLCGEVAEWSIVPDSKSGVGQPTEGSNPSLSANWLLKSTTYDALLVLCCIKYSIKKSLAGPSVPTLKTAECGEKTGHASVFFRLATASRSANGAHERKKPGTRPGKSPPMALLGSVRPRREALPSPPKPGYRSLSARC